MKKNFNHKQQKKIVQKFDISPEQGFAMMAASLQPPKGYKFHSMKREESKAEIVWVLQNEKL